jgi:hypothetical protein
MIAAFAQFYHGVALIAAFPTFFLGLLNKAGDLWVLGAVGRPMEFSSAERACFSLALRARGAFSSFLVMEVWWSDPDSASWIWAVYPVAGVILVVFLVEVDFEFEVEKVFHMRQRDVIGGATTRWHMCRVIDSHAEYSLQAWVTHAVTTGKFRGFVGR